MFLSKFRSRDRSHPIFIEDEHRYQKPKRWRLRYPLFIVLAVMLVGWAYQQVNAAEGDTMRVMKAEAAVNLDEVSAGELLFKTAEGNHYTPAMLHNSKVHLKVSGMVAYVTVEQHFKNQTPHWVEGTYVFPLPDKAAVNAMQMQIGDRVIKGQIKEKREAEKVYQQAKRSGKKASLLRQERPNLFTSKVANIAPGETISVQLTYIETVAYDHGRFSLRFPMTITPRYTPGKATKQEPEKQEPEKGAPLVTSSLGWATATDQVPDAHRITPRLNPNSSSSEDLINPITVTAELDMGIDLQRIDSAYHAIDLSRQDSSYHLQLRKGRVSMNQDFVLSWRPVVGQEPKAAIFSEQVQQEDFALIMMMPPSGKPTVLPKEVIYIVDTSGSMDGVSIKQAKQSLQFALDQLKPNDRFNIIEFNSVTKALFQQAVPASNSYLNQARQAVSQLQSGGGTEMLPALNRALADKAPEGVIRQVIFITDGAVGNEAALFKALHNKLGTSRLFTVGIGSAPNSHFMRKAAQFGRGSFTHIGKLSEVQPKMTELFTKLSSPVVTNISIQWPNNQTVETYPARIPDLYLGEPLVLTAKIKDLKGGVTISGQTGSDFWQQTLHLSGVAGHSGVSTLWAREKIGSLLDAKMRGSSADQIRSEVVNVALTHQLVSPYTSFVAVEEQMTRPANQPVQAQAVLNARPKGQGPQSYAYPQTATGARESLLWGALLLSMAAVLIRSMRKEDEYELVS